MRDLGFVIIEFNQASGQPDLSPVTYIMDDRATAQAMLEREQEENRKAGRRERYAIGTIVIEDDEDGR